MTASSSMTATDNTTVPFSIPFPPGGRMTVNEPE